jgi:hypothetical protein
MLADVTGAEAVGAATFAAVCGAVPAGRLTAYSDAAALALPFSGAGRTNRSARNATTASPRTPAEIFCDFVHIPSSTDDTFGR